MASGQFAVACRQIGRLFGSGTVAGLGEGQLLDRFAARRDPAAFEAIVARHGPMVLAVCRSLLRDPNDVDDAFQATFLVLVRKAETLRRRDLLGGWLHAVANRVARRARTDSARRRDRESTILGRGEAAGDDPERLDLRAAVHAEVDRLPESYRLAVLLCDLQGRTHEEAARELGWPVGTVKGRHHRARALLRGRLARRGLAPASGAVVALLADEGRAAVSPALLGATTSAASAVAAGPLAVGAASIRVMELTQGALTTMTTTTTKLKLAATLLVVGALAGPGASAYQGVGFGGGAGRGPAPRPPQSAPTTGLVTDPAAVAAQARVRLAEKALGALRQTESKGTNAKISEKILLWELRRAEARIDAGTPRADAVRDYLLAVRDEESRLTVAAREGGIHQADADEAEFRRLEADKVLGASETAPSPAAPNPAPVTGTFGGMGGMGGMGGGMGSGPGAMMGRPADPLTAARFRIGQMLDTEDRYPRPRRQLPTDVERNKAIEEKLEKVVPMKFADETPIRDVLKYIKEATRDAQGKEIPIYVNPIGMLEAEKTLDSPVTLDIDNVPLRTTLRLVLDQLGLGYTVRDGLLRIDEINNLKQTEDGERYWEAVERAGGAEVGPPGPNQPRHDGAQGEPGGGFQ